VAESPPRPLPAATPALSVGQIPPAPKTKSLLQRIATGLGVLAVTFAATFFPGGLVFALSVAAICVIAANEFYRAVRRQGAEPSDFLGFLAVVLFQLGAWMRGTNALDIFLPAFLVLLVLAAMLVELVKPKHTPILNIGATLLGSIYIGWLFSYLVLIHGSTSLAVAPIAGTTPGEWLVVFVVAITSSSDVGGLFFGNAFGRRKLAPSISPSKTWEGAIGGVALATLVGGLIGAWIHLPVGFSIATGAVLAAVGLLGDLCESALKRELGVKDFGVILPGHGGMLDRVDSILFTAPVAYYLFQLLAASRL
jgi:phosphatidate cytidylyltransferase